MHLELPTHTLTEAVKAIRPAVAVKALVPALEALKNIGGERVVVKAASATQPVIIEPEAPQDGKTELHMVLPVRLRAN